MTNTLSLGGVGGGLGSIFAYLAVGQSVVATIMNLYARLTTDPSITGDELVQDVTPALQSIQLLLPRVKITPDLVKRIADAVAQVLVDYRSPATPPVPPPA